MTETTADDDRESIAHAGMVEIFGALTLATPTWTIIRHPFAFERYRANPGAAIHYLYAAIGFATLASRWVSTNPGDIESGGDAAPLVDLVNRALAPVAPNAKLDGSDVLPIFLLFGNLIAGFLAYVACRWWARRNGVAASSRPASAETLAATAYFGGATSVIFGIGSLLAGPNPGDNSPFTMAVGLAILLLLYCWGRWIRKIHGVVTGKLVGTLFPYGLAFLSLLLFAGLVELLDAIAKAV